MPKQTPKISVVIPNYNYVQFLRQAIQSVQAQTFSSWQLIVVDNFSTDGSSELVSSLADDRIQLVQFANGGSIAAARNRGAEIAVGDYLAFLDSDDFWFANKLEECFRVLEAGADFVYHHLAIEGPKNTFGAKFVKARKLKGVALRDLLVNGNAVATSSVVLSTSLFRSLGGMNPSPELLGVEDYDAWLRVADAGANMVAVPRILGGYRVHPGSTSRSRMAAKVRAVVEPYLSKLSDSDLRKAKAILTYIEAREDFVLKTPGSQRKLLTVISQANLPHKVRAFYMLAKATMGRRA
jgi:glycosyltransferase involved in cell wall biosynthesis